MFSIAVRRHELSGIDEIPLILEREPDAEIIMYTIYDDYDTIFQALFKGANLGYSHPFRQPIKIHLNAQGRLN